MDTGGSVLSWVSSSEGSVADVDPRGTSFDSAPAAEPGTLRPNFPNLVTFMVLALNCETMLCRGSIYDLPPSWNIGEQQAAPIRVQSTLPYMSQVEKMGPEGPPPEVRRPFWEENGPGGPSQTAGERLCQRR